MPNQASSPECDKLAAAAPQREALSEFLEWLGETYGAALCQMHKHSADCMAPHEHDELCPRRCAKLTEQVCGGIEGMYYPMVPSNREQLIFEFLGIDAKKLEEERRALLEHARSLNAG